MLVFEEMGKPGYIEKNEALGKPPDPFDNRFRFCHAPPGSVALKLKHLLSIVCLN